MGDIREITEVQPDPAQPDQFGAAPPRTDRRYATRFIRIAGQDLDDLFLSDSVVSLTVEECARGLSKATVVLLNTDFKLTDNPLFQANLIVEIWTGYRSTTLVKRGTFYCAKPQFAFRKGNSYVELDCYSEEWPLTVSEQRAVYENYTDSDIATFIASRNGLESDVDPTTPLHEHVAQLNMTDAEFLEDRARLYGYDFYVQEGTLHFHAPRFVDSNLSLYYGTDRVAQLATFEASIDTWLSGQSWTRTGIDRLTGAEWAASSTDTPDPVASEIQKRAAASSAYRTAAALAVVNGVRPQRFIVGEGHEQTASEGQQQVAGYTQATQWIVHSMASIFGIETLKARTLVEIVGVGHLAGFYYVTRVTHRQKQGYSMTFEAVRPVDGALVGLPGRRTGTGTTQIAPPDVTAQSAVVGTVPVAGR